MVRAADCWPTETLSSYAPALSRQARRHAVEAEGAAGTWRIGPYSVSRPASAPDKPRRWPTQGGTSPELSDSLGSSTEQVPCVQTSSLSRSLPLPFGNPLPFGRQDGRAPATACSLDNGLAPSRVYAGARVPSRACDG